MWFSAPFEFSGQVAQSVEQRIENPRVGVSIPSLDTTFLFHLKSTSTSAFQRTACRLTPGGYMTQAALERAPLTLRFRPGHHFPVSPQINFDQRFPANRLPADAGRLDGSSCA